MKMSAGDKKQSDQKEISITEDKKRTQMEKDAETPISIWGVVSFALISGIMLLAIATTLGRDFVSGGLAPPL